LDQTGLAQRPVCAYRKSRPVERSPGAELVFSSTQEAHMPDPKKPQEKFGEKTGEEQEKVLDEPWDHPDQEPEKHPDLEKLRESEE
jgi:hypothetical protein